MAGSTLFWDQPLPKAAAIKLVAKALNRAVAEYRQLEKAEKKAKDQIAASKQKFLDAMDGAKAGKRSRKSGAAAGHPDLSADDPPIFAAILDGNIPDHARALGGQASGLVG